MIANKEELLGGLKTLGQSLKKTANEGPAKFIDVLSQRLVRAQNQEELKPILEEISKLATLAQYGDFSASQEALLHKVQDIALKIR